MGGLKSSVVTEAVTVDGLRRSLKTANQAKRSSEDPLARSSMKGGASSN